MNLSRSSLACLTNCFLTHQIFPHRRECLVVILNAWPISDHTTGLYKSFSAGTIYTSEGTAKLIVELMGVNQERVVALEMDKPHMVAGFELTLIDANHCPGAVM